jgi:hypothetical protein
VQLDLDGAPGHGDCLCDLLNRSRLLRSELA